MLHQQAAPTRANPTSSLKKLSSKQIQTLFESDRFTALLIGLELWAFHDAVENRIVVGFMDETVVHPHCRWLWSRPQAETYWHAHQPLCSPMGPEILTTTQLKKRLIALEGMLADNRWLELRHIPAAPEVLTVAHHRPRYDTPALINVDYTLSAVDIHDLLRHPALFKQRYPAFESFDDRLTIVYHGLPGE